jgi:sarcosine oxidase gamma subunit
MTPIARGPLLERHRRYGATIELRDGWEVAVEFPVTPAGGNLLIDRSHRPTFEINGAETESLVASLCGESLPLRRIHIGADREVYRLTPTRALLFGRHAPPRSALDVTGGWASLALVGPDAARILGKITALDLRERTLPVAACCQGPIFGVNTLFGRFADRFELHICGDSADFLCDVLFDAGREFALAPAGINAVSGVREGRKN